ncbi:probable G-protein coupled receptor 82 [Trematomus bernacchii]|uniref:probable G-protein coupled receptor 82 n=1 Tax=Trematomus bernacchii TaxID=40690 RepID=UPI00146C60BE|nr:probable G-protein coupled receptor 82 [Trematomus bernacchii]
MENISTPFPLDNSSLSSSFLSLCPTFTTLFFLPSAYTLLFLTALPGNILSLWVFLRCISTVSPIHVYLSHLSISNLILSLTTPFLAAYYAWGSDWTLSSTLCQLVLHGITPVLHINIYISIMILTWLALSRFASLIQHTHASRPNRCIAFLPHGFFSRLKRTSFANRVCIVVWSVAIGGVVPVTVIYSVKETVSVKKAVVGCTEVCYSPTVEIGGRLSAGLAVIVIALFFLFYLLVLMSYMMVLRHIGRSRKSTNVTTSQSLLGRVLRNIVVIQVVLSVCLLPYHIYKPIFISLANDQRQLRYLPGPNICKQCHPFSILVELKNCLLLLAALRGSTDPIMYFLLDKTFRHQTLKLLRCNQNKTGSTKSSSVTGSNTTKAVPLEEGNVATVTGRRHSSVKKILEVGVSEA